MIQYKINDFQIFEFSHENPKALIFFAHANGVPSLTYTELFEKIVQKFPVKIVSYDTRGIGLTSAPPLFSAKTWGWKQLVDDHNFLFQEVQKKNIGLDFIFAGHSLGAWLSLLSSTYTPVTKLLLFDPPILKPFTYFAWFFINIFGKQHLNPQSKKVKKRKITFPNILAAKESFKKSSFMKNWSDNTIQKYIESSFKSENVNSPITLRHSPDWEAHMFEQYPPTPWHGFLRIRRIIRRGITPIFFVGEKSDTCDPKAHTLVKLLLPNLSWVILPDAAHMFPIEQPDLVIKSIEPFLEKFLCL